MVPEDRSHLRNRWLATALVPILDVFTVDVETKRGKR